MREIIDKIDYNFKSKFYYNYDTSKNVWFRAGGKAKVFCIVDNEKELSIILQNLKDIPYEVIGAGSNILIRDSGYEGFLIKLGKNFNQIEIKKSNLTVGASILDINLSKFAQLNNLKNFEFYSGIPGTVGGAVKMNAGCFGSETKDILIDVKTINNKGEINIINKKNLNLNYRQSYLPEGDIIISANFHCNNGDKNKIAKKMNEIKINREKTQPLKEKTSGSTFKNPKNNFAAKLIEMSNCKGLSEGGIFVSNKHANFLINKQQGSANQIEELGNKIIEKVYDKFKIKLEWEIKIIGQK